MGKEKPGNTTEKCVSNLSRHFEKQNKIQLPHKTIGSC